MWSSYGVSATTFVVVEMIVLFVFYSEIDGFQIQSYRTINNNYCNNNRYNLDRRNARPIEERIVSNQQRRSYFSTELAPVAVTTPWRRVSSSVSSSSSTSTSLFGASVRGSSGSQRKKSSSVGKKKPRSSNNSKIKQQPTTTTSTISSSSIPRNDNNDSSRLYGTSSNDKKPTKVANMPPWQILSTKDAQMNMEREKQRRSLIQQGVVPSHVSSSMSMNSTSTTTGSTSTTSTSNPLLLSKNFLNVNFKKFLNWKRFNPYTAIVGQQFIGSYIDPIRLPPSLGVPEIAFLGRSNVGKSSLLNKLTKMSYTSSGSSSSSTKQNNKLDMARVGKTPGATASVNVYSLYDNKGKNLLGFIDLPGFGYAKLSKQTKESVQLAAENYLNRRKELVLGILLIDIRRGTDDNDMENNYDMDVLNALYDMNIPVIVVATKIDKIKSVNEMDRCLQGIRTKLDLPDIQQPFCVSSTTGDGIRELWQIILDAGEMSVSESNQLYEGNNGARRRQYDDDEGNEDDDDDFYKEMDNSSNKNVKNMNNDYDDDEDIVYDQGYEWTTPANNNDDEFDNNDDDNTSDVDETAPLLIEPPPRETLKTLRRRVKEMEKRGEI